MSLVATEKHVVSNLVKAELWKDLGYCREVVTVNEAAAKSYVVGTVLGKVTASGKYKIAVETAVDGSKAFAAFVLEAKDIAATTDTKIVVLVKGPASVSKGAMSLDSTYDNDTKKNTLYAEVEAKGIQVLSA